MFVRRVIVGSTGFLVAASPVVSSKAPSVPQTPEESPSKEPPLIRPSELPIYPTPTSTVAKLDLDESSELEKTLMEPVRIVRTSLVSAVHQMQDITSQIGTTVYDTTDKFSFLITYLREEDNEAQRIGATAIGTLTGFIFGLRGGIFKKITYSLLGTAGMGSLCYPEEAQQYFNQSLTQGKLLAHVAYNFVLGIKPGDPEAAQFLPDFKVPTSFAELTTLIKSSISKNQTEDTTSAKEEEKSVEESKK